MSETTPPVILCVEDESHLLDELVEELTVMGYTAIGATNADEAEAVLAAQHPDVILCDIMMPGRSGIELLAGLRGSRNELDVIPFIFLTALSDRDHQLAGRRSGADDYLTKPVDFDLLDAAIRGKLELVERIRSSGTLPQVPEDGLVHLSRREIEVLSALAGGATIAQIAGALDLSEHTIGDYVKSLYRKLGVSSRAEVTREALRRGLISL